MKTVAEWADEIFLVEMEDLVPIIKAIRAEAVEEVGKIIKAEFGNRPYQGPGPLGLISAIKKVGEAE